MDENKKKKEKIDKKGRSSTSLKQPSKLTKLKEAIAPPVSYYTEDDASLLSLSSKSRN